MESCSTALVESSFSDIWAVTSATRANVEESSDIRVVPSATATTEAPSEMRAVTTNESSRATATTDSDGSRAREALLHDVPTQSSCMYESTMDELAAILNRLLL